MSYTNGSTSVSEQDTSAAQLAANDLPTNPLTDESVVFVADGEWEDPRKEFTGQYVENHGEQTNVVGKLQHSITIRLEDGSTMLVSAFGAKTRLLKNLKLGGTYAFKGKLKTKTENFQGAEKTSRFLNL